MMAKHESGKDNKKPKRVILGLLEGAEPVFRKEEKFLLPGVNGVPTDVVEAMAWGAIISIMS